jgi:hypothetical protein
MLRTGIKRKKERKREREKERKREREKEGIFMEVLISFYRYSLFRLMKTTSSPISSIPSVTLNWPFIWHHVAVFQEQTISMLPVSTNYSLLETTLKLLK